MKDISITKMQLEANIIKMMHNLGIPAHIKGYQYIRYDIMEVVYNADKINGITKCLYPEIAKMCETSASNVERNIYHAIEIASGKNKTKTMDEMFGYVACRGKAKPTNAEFIAVVAESIRLHMKCDKV